MEYARMRRIMATNYDPLVRAYTLAEQQAHEDLQRDTDEEIRIYQHAPGVLEHDRTDATGGYSYEQMV